MSMRAAGNGARSLKLIVEFQLEVLYVCMNSIYTHYFTGIIYSYQLGIPSSVGI